MKLLQRCGIKQLEVGVGSLIFRVFNDWELDLAMSLLSALQHQRASSELDGISWKSMVSDSFSVCESYRVLL